jgi:hypothetical protein
MLRRHEPVVLERQPELPNNHHAVLRFRSEEVSRALNIPFRRVRVFKSCDEADPVRAAILYAMKVTGRYEVRSLIDLSPCDRFIAPPDLVEQMARGMDIHYGVDSGAPDREHHDEPWISTIPMPALMDLLDYPGERPAFVSVPGWTVTATVADCDMFVTRYLTKPNQSPYRISITGDQLIVEGSGMLPTAPTPEGIAWKAGLELGVAPSSISGCVAHESRYMKIGRLSASDRNLASSFMFWATAEHNVYSLGRFATWRAGLLMDDLVQDVRKIEGWINSSPYDIRKTI